MTRFELEYLIHLRSDAILESLSLMTGLQIAIIVAIYYLKGVRDPLVRHAIFGLYTLAHLVTFLKSVIDLSVIGSHIREITSLFPQGREGGIGILRLPEYTGETFTTMLVLLYAMLWAGTLYFLYFHEFNELQEQETKKRSPLPPDG